MDSDVGKMIGEQEFKELTDEAKRIINYAAEHKKINVSQAQRLTQRSWKSSKTLLDSLAKKGILLHIHRADVDRDPDAHYILRTSKTRTR